MSFSVEQVERLVSRYGHAPIAVARLAHVAASASASAPARAAAAAAAVAEVERAGSSADAYRALCALPFAPAFSDETEAALRAAGQARVEAALATFESARARGAPAALRAAAGALAEAYLGLGGGLLVAGGPVAASVVTCLTSAREHVATPQQAAEVNTVRARRGARALAPPPPPPPPPLAATWALCARFLSHAARAPSLLFAGAAARAPDVQRRRGGGAAVRQARLGVVGRRGGRRH